MKRVRRPPKIAAPRFAWEWPPGLGPFKTTGRGAISSHAAWTSCSDTTPRASVESR
jgi:hypothetical protein